MMATETVEPQAFVRYGETFSPFRSVRITEGDRAPRWLALYQSHTTSELYITHLTGAGEPVGALRWEYPAHMVDDPYIAERFPIDHQEDDR